MKLEGKVALVTGGGSGIGRAASLLFAGEGGRVAVVDLREDAAKATAEAIERAGGEALPLRADVSRSADNEAAVAATVARWGRLDVFYANAGVPQSPTPIEDVDEETFDRIMAVMTDRRVRHLPVIEGSRLAGIISIGDVVKARISETLAEVEAMTAYVRG